MDLKNSYVIQGNILYVEVKKKNKIFQAQFDVDDKSKLVDVQHTIGVQESKDGVRYLVFWHYPNVSNITYVHRFILGVDIYQSHDMEVDHINFDTFDCRKENLRIVTKQHNRFHRRIFKNNTTGYKGVSFSKNREKYLAYVYKNYRRIDLGYFDSAIEASSVVDKARQIIEVQHISDSEELRNMIYAKTL